MGVLDLRVLSVEVMRLKGAVTIGHAEQMKLKGLLGHSEQCGAEKARNASLEGKLKAIQTMWREEKAICVRTLIQIHTCIHGR